MAERGGKSAAVGKGLLEQTRKVFHLGHEAGGGEISRPALGRKMKPIRERAKELQYAGTQSGHDKARHRCANILQIESALWRFVRVEGVEATNNKAERPLMRAALRRKKSFGTQSESGSGFVEWVLTVVRTLRQQGGDVLDYLTSDCEAKPCCLPPDST
jgi:hypothetical protein